MHGGEPLRSEADMRAELEERIRYCDKRGAFVWGDPSLAAFDRDVCSRYRRMAAMYRAQLANLDGGKS
jgi:hypothetical protein